MVASDYVYEPPGEVQPAMVAALLAEGHTRATGDAFTATMFDLIRRGYIAADHASVVKKTWGGLRQEDVSDLAVTITDKPPADLEPYEKEVRSAVKRAVTDSGGRLMLTEFKNEIKKEPAYYASRFNVFKSGVTDALKDTGWWLGEGRKPAGLAALAFWALTIGCIYIAVKVGERAEGFPWAALYWGIAAGFLGVNALIMLAFLMLRRGWERRSREGAEMAAKWGAFRRFLEDFPGIPQAAPASIAIWDQFLCYGIALGVADRVLEAAQLHAPEELQTTSNVYWINSSGPLGSGHSGFAISDISGAVASAAAPSSGGGGGFSGGGGGGGGGGGAW